MEGADLPAAIGEKLGDAHNAKDDFIDIARGLTKTPRAALIARLLRFNTSARRHTSRCQITRRLRMMLSKIASIVSL
jgi:hypothetical protein